MAAPSNTKWGSIVGGYGRIGISLQVSHTNNTTTVVLETWFWSKYSVRDSNNSYYYSKHSTSATGLVGSIKISTSVDSGGGWSTSNQVRLGGPSTYTYSRGASAQTYNYAIKFAGIERVGGTMYCTNSVTVPAKPSYTVTFVNGYGGTIKTQTVYHGGNASAPANPSRTGYTFTGWSGSYTNVTSSRTITATWSIWKYTISYNANGGSGAPGSQTKNYGSNITLSSTRPTRANYNFLGWSTSSTGGVNYNPGSTYSANANVTLYAVWQLAYKKPRVSGFSVQRCNSAGTASESGTYGKVSFSWSTDRTVSAIRIQHRAQNASEWTDTTVSASGTSGSVNQVFGGGGLSAETSYIVRVYVSDNGGTTYSSELSLGTIKYPIDVKDGGTGVAFGKVAEGDSLVDFGWMGNFRKGLICTDNSGNSQFSRNGVSTAWVDGRRYAPFKMNSLSGYSAFASIKTTNGTWDIGTYDNPSFKDMLVFTHIKDSNFNSGNNTTSGQIRFEGDNIYGYVPWGYITGKPGTFPPSSHSHHYLSKDGDTVNGRGSLYYLSSNVEIGCGSSGYTNNAYVQAYNGYCSIRSYSQSIYNNGAYIDSNWSHGKFYPQNSGQALGASTSGNRWYRLYASAACNTSSDRRLKKDISYFDESPVTFSNGKSVFEEFFDNLRGTTFVAKDDEFNRIKFGFIAQDVIEALEAVGLTAYDVDFVSHGRDENDKISEDAMYGLCYEEFIALNTHMIQKAHKKIDEQQIKIESQQKEIDALKDQVQELKNLVLNLSNKTV